LKKIDSGKKLTCIFFAFALMISIFIAGCSEKQGASVSQLSSDVNRFVMDNGMEVILKENHSSPMITSLIFVKAGAKYENEYNNGVTHFLEHLLFNGTANKTQEEIDHGIEKLGGYINAFTRKEFTAYLVLMPKDYIDYGIATQADMLFNSIFPEDKLKKERGIVTEEIKKDKDAEGAPAEAFFARKAMAGTPYDQPILGYEENIANIPGEAIIDYYKTYYAPNNMTVLIIGDFDSDEMKEKVENIFGQFESVELPDPPKFQYRPIKGKNTFKTAANVKSTYIKYSIEAPHFSENDYYAFQLLEDYLSDSENSPIIKSLKSGGESLITDFAAYLDTKEEFTRLILEIITENPNVTDSIIAITDSTITSLAQNTMTEDLLKGYKISRRANEIYMSEKLHFYGFTIAPLMAITGWEFFKDFYDNLDQVTLADINSATEKYFSSPAFITTAVYSQSDPDVDIFQVSGPGENTVEEYFAQADYPEYDLESGSRFEYPEAELEPDGDEVHAQYLKEILPNGLTIIIKSNPDSRVFALNVIGKNRSANEPEGKAGITDFVNRMIEKGTQARNAEQLASELASIGANVTLYDNPWIPFDDRYTTRQFSFMKFETIDRFTEDGIALFAEMIKNPRFDSAAVEDVRQEIFGLLGRNSGSTYKTARQLFYETLFAGTAYTKPITGTFRTINAITVEDLKEHHKKFYSPQNMIITIGTNEEPEKILTLLKEHFESMPQPEVEYVLAGIPSKVEKVNRAHEKMTKEQVYIYIGNLLPSAKSEDAAAIKVANTILSNRMRYNLREKQGLAYSVGSGVNFDKDFGWLICSMGTGAANFERARKGMIAEIERLKNEPPTKDELEEAINSLWGSNLMAKLSRINQAYYMGVNEYLGLGYNYDDTYINRIREVTPEKVIEVAQEYFNTEGYVLATAGDI